MHSIKRNVLLTPGPATTTDSVKHAQVVPDICPREQTFSDVLRTVCQKLCRVVHAEESHVAVLFGASGTGGVESCLSSVVPENGKLLVHINGAYGHRMAQIAHRYLRSEQVRVVEQRFGQFPDMQDLETIFQSDPQISHLALVHHETTTGMLNPAKAMTQLAHTYGAEVIVDAIASYAGVAINLSEESYDFVIASSNKCIQGMAGLSFVIAAPDKIRKTQDYPKRNFYFNLANQFSFFEQTSQMQFTPPVQVVYALDQALDELFLETPQGRIARYAECWDAVVSGFQRLGFEFLLSREVQAKLITTVVEPDHPSFHFQDFHDALYGQGFTVYPGKIPGFNCFRIGNIGAIDPSDIQAFLGVVEAYLVSRNIKL